MEEFIQILFFLVAMAIAFVGQYAKNKKKQETVPPQDTLEDLFPEIEILGDETVMSQPVQEPISPLKKPVIKKQPISQTKVPAPPITTPKKEKKIGISSREEARRAFIYSEIFNRKY